MFLAGAIAPRRVPVPATVAARDVKSAFRGHGRRQEIRLPVLAREQKSCQRSIQAREDRAVPPSSGGYLVRQVHRDRQTIRDTELRSGSEGVLR